LKSNFYPLGLELDLTFELCHLTLFEIWCLRFKISLRCLGFGAWNLGFNFRGLGFPSLINQATTKIKRR
jgi:hypothetical protein